MRTELLSSCQLAVFLNPIPKNIILYMAGLTGGVIYGEYEPRQKYNIEKDKWINL